MSEGGLAWRTKSPPYTDDILVIEAHDLFELIGVGDQTLRARVVNVRPEGLGYHRVSAAFIGLSAASRDTIRRFVQRENERQADAEKAAQ